MDGQNFNNGYEDMYQQNTPAPNKASGLSIAALVVAIVGIVLGCCSGLLGVVCGIVALVLGVVGNKQSKTGLGTAAIVVAIVCIVLSIISWIIGIVFLANADTMIQELENMGYTY